MRPYMRAMIEAGQPFMVRTRFRLADGGIGHFRGIFAPMRRADGEITCWSTLTSRAEGVRASPADALRESLEQAVRGRHMRAARGLLDWSMQDLARASGLSLSTIRRLEEGGEGPAARSRHAAVAALRQAGIGFVFLDATTLSVAKVR
jgi:DNA-binding XRE family transcriptional regulator